MRAIAHAGCMDTVRESALKGDFGRKKERKQQQKHSIWEREREREREGGGGLFVACNVACCDPLCPAETSPAIACIPKLPQEPVTL